MTDFAHLPIRILKESELPDPGWKERIEKLVRTHLPFQPDPNANYQDLQVELSFYDTGNPSKITVHITYADRYFFETKEILLDESGNAQEV